MEKKDIIIVSGDFDPIHEGRIELFKEMMYADMKLVVLEKRCNRED